MQNQEIRNILVKELGLEGIPEEAQDEIVKKVGESVLKSLASTIFERIPNDVREEFTRISASNDKPRIQDFLEEHVPDLHILMEEEVRKALRGFAETKEVAK